MFIKSLLPFVNDLSQLRSTTVRNHQAKFGVISGILLLQPEFTMFILTEHEVAT